MQPITDGQTQPQLDAIQAQCIANPASFAHEVLSVDKVDILHRTAGDDFLLREELDLLAAYKTIRSKEARRAVMNFVAVVVQAEREGKTLPPSFEVSAPTNSVHKQ